MREYLLYIGGQDVEGTSNVHYIPAQSMLDDVITAISLKRRLDRGGSPEPDDVLLSRCAVADKDLIWSASAAAHRAGPGWRRISQEQRFRLFDRFHEELDRRGDEFIDVLVQEGHPRRFAEIELASILDATAPASVEFYAQQMTQSVEVPNRKLKLTRKPDGVVGLSPPQNASATNSATAVCVLAAGNTVVLRAPHSSPTGVFFLFREIVAPILEELGAPPGTLNIITAQTALTLRQWIEDPLVDDIFYFGDSVRGLALGKECLATNTKAILELAGNDSLVVWEDADLDHAAWALAETFIGSGQVCLVPKVGIVHPAIADEFLRKFVAAVKTIKPAPLDDHEAWLSPVMKSDRYFELLQEALDGDAQLLVGGYRCDVDGDQDEAGVFIAPTVVRVDGFDRAEKLRAVREETFFPLIPVVVPDPGTADLLDDVLIFVEGNQYGLRNSLWATDPAVIDRFCDELQTGGLLKVNDSHIGTVAPLPAHGGTGLSGGPFGGANLPVLTTTHLQGVCVGDGRDPREAVWGMTKARSHHATGV